ncbi:OadG family protein [Desulfosporosinus sp. BICA1-9]|uniref:OadG family protein n=1 Tax=Desulfosporosinus sp. BICA1-9 TaxID=1531958 RepID=UPI00054B4A43|nr:OadG family protein [Desulfosporosinus sp. BICA1-9]KJS85355.1 MAG: hypothetical protein JL57_19030 [Desulfosporosinus sp. BICA1-9]HBW37201.1 hypothetical protein [Desulfosporosinus sp.]
MTIADKLLLGANTTMIGMGIVFTVLIALWVVIVLETKLISSFSERFKKPAIADLPVNLNNIDVDSDSESIGLGMDEDELRAIILAVVSNYADIPLSRLQIKSIKAL